MARRVEAPVSSPTLLTAGERFLCTCVTLEGASWRRLTVGWLAPRRKSRPEDDGREGLTSQTSARTRQDHEHSPVQGWGCDGGVAQHADTVMSVLSADDAVDAGIDSAVAEAAELLSIDGVAGVTVRHGIGCDGRGGESGSGGATRPSRAQRNRASLVEHRPSAVIGVK